MNVFKNLNKYSGRFYVKVIKLHIRKRFFEMMKNGV